MTWNTEIMIPRWLMRIATISLGIIPIIQLCILAWWGAKVPGIQDIMGPGELGLAIPSVSLPFAVILLAWTLTLAILKSPSTMHLSLQMIVVVLMSVQFHIAGMKIGVWCGLMEQQKKVSLIVHQLDAENSVRSCMELSPGESTTSFPFAASTSSNAQPEK